MIFCIDVFRNSIFLKKYMKQTSKSGFDKIQDFKNKEFSKWNYDTKKKKKLSQKKVLKKKKATHIKPKIATQY